jgi:DNA-directed RNA polymerase specialized sigma24 family protein
VTEIQATYPDKSPPKARQLSGTVFVDHIRSLASFERERGFVTWLIRTGLNESLKMSKRQAARAIPHNDGQAFDN